jgi:glycerol-1-phosphate dehydrogenase [NAD(P)+]
MTNPIYIGTEAVEKLVEYCQQHGLHHFALVADDNTYRALGERVESALTAQGYEITSIILRGDEIIADETYLVETLIRAPLGECTFLAVGSGTLTDITRFVSHRSGRAFISLPTAPSVDGFTSVGAPLVLRGFKDTINCQAPVALFADLDTLRSAPQRLIAAGYGDMIGKLTSLADWRLGALLWDEPFDEGIYQRVASTVERTLHNTDAIGQSSAEGVRQLIDALIESGLCMLEVGNSRPASGAEHHTSHYWEMKLLQEHRPAILHGAKVGVALALVAGQYAKIRALSGQEMLDRLEGATFPERDREIDIIREGYGELADGVIAEHRAFLDMTPEQFETVKQRIANRWDEIQAAAATVPPPDEIRQYLRRAGAPATGTSLGLSDDEIKRGLQYGHYLRDRFTVMKLSRVLDVPLA